MSNVGIWGAAGTIFHAHGRRDGGINIAIVIIKGIRRVQKIWKISKSLKVFKEPRKQNFPNTGILDHPSHFLSVDFKSMEGEPVQWGMFSHHTVTQFVLYLIHYSFATLKLVSVCFERCTNTVTLKCISIILYFAWAYMYWNVILYVWCTAQLVSYKMCISQLILWHNLRHHQPSLIHRGEPGRVVQEWSAQSCWAMNICNEGL